MKYIEKSIKSESFIFTLFRSMYRERRKYWLYNIWKEPAFFGQVLILGTFEAAKAIPDIAEAFPSFMNLTSTWWIPAIVIIIGMSLLLHKFILLDPRKQFVPPKLSLESISNMIELEAKRIASTRGENAKIATISLTILVGIATGGAGILVGVLLGQLGWLFGKDLSVMKREASNNITTELENCFEEIDECIVDWINQTKKDLYRASLESFKKNCFNISGFLTKRTDIKLLTSAVNKR